MKVINIGDLYCIGSSDSADLPDLRITQIDNKKSVSKIKGWVKSRVWKKTYWLISQRNNEFLDFGRNKMVKVKTSAWSFDTKFWDSICSSVEQDPYFDFTI